MTLERDFFFYVFLSILRLFYIIFVLSFCHGSRCHGFEFLSCSMVSWFSVFSRSRFDLSIHVLSVAEGGSKFKRS